MSTDYKLKLMKPVNRQCCMPGQGHACSGWPGSPSTALAFSIMSLIAFREPSCPQSHLTHRVILQRGDQFGGHGIPAGLGVVEEVHRRYAEERRQGGQVLAGRVIAPPRAKLPEVGR